MSHTHIKPRNETDKSIQSPQINHKLVVSCTNLRVGALLQRRFGDHFKLRGRMYVLAMPLCMYCIHTFPFFGAAPW